MTTQVTPFRVTVEDLDGLDGKTREGLMPLIDALNVFGQQVVQAVAFSPQESFADVVLAVGPVVEDSFPLVFRNPLESTPRWVGLSVKPRDVNHDLTNPFVMQGFGVTAQGLISVPWITNLLASNTYDLTFLVKT